ncbi:HD-GYP domain-containing protein [Gracilibacillus lacisalsi]|uniref:HD-GYP domain-containing protein n=1 Tax=Gracilibacillus lacisalsi TaxID=393087 RepID=UPI00035F4DE5|nr:HD-GYP domain-containing protein [Gracilibacillus lacisalsi]
MENIHKYTNLLNEEKRTTIWFLWLFYVIYFGYEIIYYYILPQMPWNLVSNGLKTIFDFYLYAILLALLPIAIYLLKRNKPSPVKYIYFIVFTVANVIIELIYFLSNNETYNAGNIVEMVFVLFSPIFVNKRFFYFVSLVQIFKYIFIGIVLNQYVVLIPLLLLLVFATVACIVLYRFLGYVNSLKLSYDNQLEGIVKGVIATLELKDPYTRGHSERVANYAMILAKSLKEFKNQDIKLFYYACLLHDVGKIHISDVILSKPGKLTAEEFEIIKSHPVVGAEAVKDVEGINEYITVIRDHHERWDGKGYPNGLKAEETNLFARITAIADAFDAMTSSRSYREAMPLEKAYEQIVNGSGSQFDPILVEKVKEVFPLWIEYHKQYYAERRDNK